MKKSSGLLATLMMPIIAATLAASCAGGEMAPSGTGASSGSGGSASSGGRTGGGTGGSTTFGTGGATSSGSGGATSSGSGGATSSSGGSTSASGGATFGSGGSTSTGTGGSTGGGTGGAPVAGGALTVADGYAMGGTWMGYAYTFTGPMTGSKATVSPMTFAAMTSLCASGMIAADLTYASVAGMGWNINQVKATTATAPAIGTTAASGTGLAINVGSPTGLTLITGGASQLRAQVKTATGDFCAPLVAGGVQMIPWAMFNSKCWNTTETGAAAFVPGTAIKAVELVIPSAATAVGPFNVCLLDAKPY